MKLEIAGKNKDKLVTLKLEGPDRRGDVSLVMLDKGGNRANILDVEAIDPDSGNERGTIYIRYLGSEERKWLESIGFSVTGNREAVVE